MTIINQKKHISSESDEKVIVDAQLNNSTGILTLKRKNYYENKNSDPVTTQNSNFKDIQLDLSKIKLRIIVTTEEHLGDLTNSSDPEDITERETHIFLVPYVAQGETEPEEGIYRECIWSDDKNGFEIIGSTKMDLTSLLKKTKVVDNLTTNSFNLDDPTALSANQGRVLKNLVDNKSHVEFTSAKNNGIVVGTITIDGTPITLYQQDTTYSAEKGINLSNNKFGHENTEISPQNTAALKSIKFDKFGHITGVSNPPSASTSTSGIVKLYNDIDSDSTTLAATAAAVKKAAQKTTAKEIPNNANLNSDMFRTTGWWIYSSDGYIVSATNVPSGITSPFFMETLYSYDDYTHKLIQKIYSETEFWVRYGWDNEVNNNDNGWTNWVQFASTSLATQNSNGLMSNSDKTKLDNLEGSIPTKISDLTDDVNLLTKTVSDEGYLKSDGTKDNRTFSLNNHTHSYSNITNKPNIDLFPTQNSNNLVYSKGVYSAINIVTALANSKVDTNLLLEILDELKFDEE